MGVVKHFEENTIGTDYVVGDIHGCFSKLTCALAIIGFDETKDRLFSVGDLVDRGPESEDALEWLAKPWFHAVRGNHEQMAIDYADGFTDCYYEQNGGGWMMRLPKPHQRLFANAFKELPIAIDVKVAGRLYGIVHADPIYDDWETLLDALNHAPKATPLSEAVMWDRNRWNSKKSSPVRNVELVYVGHTPMKDGVQQLGNIVYIDTGAVFKNGSMTIIEISKENV